MSRCKDLTRIDKFPLKVVVEFEFENKSLLDDFKNDMDREECVRTQAYSDLKSIINRI